jgi:uncharacterized membrane protein
MKNSDNGRVHWGQLGRGVRMLIVTLAGLQLALLLAALLDLWRRPAGQVRGRKWWWALASLVDFIGPLAYFRFGRLRI